MSVQVENLEHNMAKLTIEVSADELEKAIETAYRKEKSRISIPGFRKGRVSRAVIEKMYGPEIFYDDAANTVMQRTYPSAVEESGVDIVSNPVVEVIQIEKGKPFIYTAEVAVKPEVTLGKYMGVTVTKMDTSVSEEEIAAELEEERNKNARTVTVTDRPVQDGDTAVIDFVGYVDGVPFEGGKAENHSLEIGSHTFIDTFEEQLIGKNAGDDVDVNVTFPNQYQAEELAGKPALFKVKIHEIKAKELPELDDEFASEVSEKDTLAEFKEEIRERLAEEKKEDARNAQEQEAVQKIVEDSTMDIPDAMIDTECENMIDDFAERIRQNGMSFEQYLQYTGTDRKSFKEQIRPEALKRIQNGLVLGQIAQEEKIEVSEEDIAEEIKKMAEAYKMEADKLKEYIGEAEKASMKNDIAIAKTLEFIMNNVVEEEKADTGDEGEATEE